MSAHLAGLRRTGCATPTDRHRTGVPDTLLSWLVERAAGHLGIPSTHLDPAVPLAEYGLDSVGAVGLCGDVEEHLGIETDPTLVFDYPTLHEIARFLTSQLQPVTPGARA